MYCNILIVFSASLFLKYSEMIYVGINFASK